MKNVCFVGGKQAGIVGLLTVLSKGYKVVSAVSYSEDLDDILSLLGITYYRTIKTPEFKRDLSEVDILVCVHGREIFPKSTLDLVKHNFNIHPCLSAYKGADPVGRAIENKDKFGSVGSHILTEVLDGGRILKELFINISDCKTRIEIYNKLYPLYTEVIIKTLDLIEYGENLQSTVSISEEY
jgi:methionyl-tRNA formyltransferase